MLHCLSAVLTRGPIRSRVRGRMDQPSYIKEVHSLQSVKCQSKTAAHPGFLSLIYSWPVLQIIFLFQTLGAFIATQLPESWNEKTGLYFLY